LILADRLIPTAELIPTTDHSAPIMKATVLIAEDAVEQALALQPDVLSLDTRTPGMTGLEAAQTLAEDWPDLAKPFPLLVFVTAYDQDASHAFEQAAVDYVLKPVQPDRLEKTCARLQAALQQRAQSEAAQPSWDAAIHTLRELM